MYSPVCPLEAQTTFTPICSMMVRRWIAWVGLSSTIRTTLDLTFLVMVASSSGPFDQSDLYLVTNCIADVEGIDHPANTLCQPHHWLAVMGVFAGADHSQAFIL